LAVKIANNPAALKKERDRKTSVCGKGMPVGVEGKWHPSKTVMGIRMVGSALLFFQKSSVPGVSAVVVIPLVCVASLMMKGHNAADVVAAVEARATSELMHRWRWTTG
jgi:hypothetical protein